jgi:hypothetical protein
MPMEIPVSHVNRHDIAIDKKRYSQTIQVGEFEYKVNKAATRDARPDISAMNDK